MADYNPLAQVLLTLATPHPGNILEARHIRRKAFFGNLRPIRLFKGRHNAYCSDLETGANRVEFNDVNLGKGCCLCLIAAFMCGCTSWETDRSINLNRDGVTLLNRNDLPGAHAKFTEAWKLQPNDPDTLYNLASTYHRHGQVKVAEDYYRQALQKQPEHGPCRHNYHLLMVSQNRSAEAYDDAKKTLAARPNSVDAQAEMGWLTRLRGDLPAAQNHLQLALAQNPQHSLALLEMGKLYQAYEMPERARTLYQRIPAQDQHYAEAQGLLTGLKKSSGNPRAS